MYKTPILAIIFNRPDFTKILYDTIKLLEPAKLYIISDGPRSLKEEEIVMRSREIFNTIEWDCEVKYHYSNVNLGLRICISNGITWAFQHEERLIILEDDCIPHKDFFWFCEELLTKYQDDTRIMAINGCNLNPHISRNNSELYFFSKYANSWGWATWKRAWNLYDGELAGLENANIVMNFAFNLPYRYRTANYWNYKLDAVKKEKINSWAYRWTFTLWINNGLAIVPSSNLIQNIGNDQRSTNTKGHFHYLNIRTTPINKNKLKEPNFIVANSFYDKWLEDNIYSKSIINRLFWATKKIFHLI